MDCPKSIKLKPATVTKEKCIKNMDHWTSRYPDFEENDSYNENLRLSNNILPCHTFAYEALKPIFGYEAGSNSFIKKKAKLQSARKRLLASGKTSYSTPPQHMEEAISYGHDVFTFAYHGIHNPYHRHNDPPPVRPFGVFLKKEIEIFSCVHGSPWDITKKNKQAQKDLDEGNLDKYYLLPADLRKLKPIQIQQIGSLRGNFWYYFGNPDDWKSTKGYGIQLFETAGEFRYYEEILPDQIKAILWPMWYSDSALVDENLDLQAAFKNEFPEIEVINYTLDKFENFVLSLVEASFFTQRYYLEKGKFPINAETAKIKIKP